MHRRLLLLMACLMSFCRKLCHTLSSSCWVVRWSVFISGSGSIERPYPNILLDLLRWRKNRAEARFLYAVSGFIESDRSH